MISTKFTYRKIVVVFMPSQTKFTIFTVIGKGNFDFQTKQFHIDLPVLVARNFTTVW